MLADHDAIATLAVSDLARARDFYEGVLGLGQPDEPAPDGLVFHCGSTQILVYTSAYAGTNKATSMSLQVPLEAFDSEVQTLRDRGVTFQTFDMEGVEWDDGVASYGDTYRSVWFEDPDGNIINVAASRRDG